MPSFVLYISLLGTASALSVQSVQSSIKSRQVAPSRLRHYDVPPKQPPLTPQQLKAEADRLLDLRYEELGRSVFEPEPKRKEQKSKEQMQNELKQKAMNFQEQAMKATLKEVKEGTWPDDDESDGTSD